MILSSLPKEFHDISATPATDHMFQIRYKDETQLLPEEQSEMGHHNIAQLIFISASSKQDIQTTVIFSTTTVKNPDNYYWRK